MKNIQNINDVCKEVLIVLAYLNDDLIKKVPTKILKNLRELAADSKLDLYIDTEKRLDEQDISEESKDLISLIYYDYLADEKEKSEILNIWNYNENKYQENLRKKYNPDNIFKNEAKEEHINLEALENNTDTALIEYKESFFTRFKNFIFKILHINK